MFGLRWGIKHSFVDYIRRMPDGQGAVSNGARPVGDYEIVYAPEATGHRPGPDGSSERFWLFNGDVRFAGHFGMLSVRIAYPRIVLSGDQAQLDIADPYSNDREQRLFLATLTLTEVPAEDGVERWVGSDVRLAAGGVELFNEVYPAGEKLEDLRIDVPLVTPEGQAGPIAAE
ncbi:hypothetical protein GCM10020369_05600 [Cryptosporangium minutisporangium]|uniref:Htaa domain-containing protein n=2 Tax=Cryptosporangium minutisporangium TaxID=113569 RepID=A0ABP6SS23_9ACTN